MVRKKKLTVEELRALMPRILAAAEAPLAVLEFAPEELTLDFENMPEEDSAISRSPIASPELLLECPREAPEVRPSTYPSLPVCGTHPICIRVPVRLIRAYKEQARRTGRNYQTLMNDALRNAANAFV